MVLVIKSKKEMEALSEDELRGHIIIPVLQALGYQGVEHTHGPNEQGKDIVFWKEDDLGAREYIAVVAKKGKITGAAKQIGEITTQVKQALGESFVDTESLEHHEIHKCWVVSSGKITSAGPQSLRNALKTDGLLGRVKIIPGERLWELFLDHVPQKSVFGRLSQAANAVEQFLPGFEATVRKSGTQFTYAGSDEQSFQLIFSGSKGAGKWDEFVRSGRETTFAGEDFSLSGLPEPQMMLMGQMQEMIVATSQTEPLCRGRIMVFGPRPGQNLTLLIEDIYILESGTERVLFGPRRDKDSPFSARFELHRATSGTNVSFAMNPPYQCSLHANLIFSLFEATLCEGGTLALVDEKTGRTLLGGPNPKLEKLDGGDLKYLEYLAKAATIQDLVTPPLSFDREYLLAEDVVGIDLVFHILRHGTPPSGTNFTFGFDLQRDQIESNFGPDLDKSVQLKFQTPYTATVLDRSIYLGAAKAECHVRISNKVEVEEQIQSGETEKIQVMVTSDSTHPIEADISDLQTNRASAAWELWKAWSGKTDG